MWTKGDAAVVLLATVWDTTTDAVEFTAALPRDRSTFGFRQAGAKVGIVAGISGDRREALLQLMVKP